MKTELARGIAYGYVDEAKKSLNLWARVACGNAPLVEEDGIETHLGTVHKNFLKLIEALDTHSWEYISVLAEAAFKLLVECEQAEGSNRASAWIRLFRNNQPIDDCMDKRPTSMVLCWAGQWTKNREIALELRTRRNNWQVTLAWDTGTGKESSYLGLPSMATGGEWTPHQPISPRAEDIIKGGKAAFVIEQYKSAAVRSAIREAYAAFVDAANDLASLDRQVRRSGHIVFD